MALYLIAGLLIVAGVINFLPVVGVLGPERLKSLYGVPFGDPNLIILMRHRALLFGLLGGFMIWSAFRPSTQWLAVAAGLISMVGYIVIAWQVGGYNDQLRRVIQIDVAATAALVAVAGLLLFRAPH